MLVSLVMSNFATLWPLAARLLNPLNSPGKSTGVGSLSLLQGIFPTQETNSGLLHWRRILPQLSHRGSPRILEWLACPFSRVIFPSQKSNQGILNCRQILYQLRYQGNPYSEKGDDKFPSCTCCLRISAHYLILHITTHLLKQCSTSSHL